MPLHGCCHSSLLHWAYHEARSGRIDLGSANSLDLRRCKLQALQSSPPLRACFGGLDIKAAVSGLKLDASGAARASLLQHVVLQSGVSTPCDPSSVVAVLS